MEILHERLASRAFRGERPVTVILPPSYRESRRRYAVLYLHDGSSDWLHHGDLLRILRRTMDAGEIPEILTVLPEPLERTREYKLSRAHVQFMTAELVPWVDDTFRTRPRAAARAVHGVSLGGLMAVWLGLRHPERFGAAGGQGGAYWYWRQRVVKMASRDGAVGTRFFLACGEMDGNLGDNRDLAEALAGRGATYRYEEVPGRHSWACWRRTLSSALRYYFRGPSQRA